MREAEHDLSFAEFGNGSKRLYPAPALEPGERDPSNYADSMARLRTSTLNRTWEWLEEVDNLRSAVESAPGALSEASGRLM
jgi:hypothetical protein